MIYLSYIEILLWPLFQNIIAYSFGKGEGFHDDAEIDMVTAGRAGKTFCRESCQFLKLNAGMRYANIYFIKGDRIIKAKFLMKMGFLNIRSISDV
jgi:hypothetical protein